MDPHPPLNTLLPTKIQPRNCLQTHIGSAWYSWRQLACSQFQRALGRSCLPVISDQAVQLKSLPLTILRENKPALRLATAGYYNLDYLIQLPSQRKIQVYTISIIVAFLFSPKYPVTPSHLT